ARSFIKFHALRGHIAQPYGNTMVTSYLKAASARPGLRHHNRPCSRGVGMDRQLLQRISVVAVVEELGTDLLRYRMPEHMRPFRVPFAVSRLPVVPVLANASIALLLIISNGSRWRCTMRKRIGVRRPSVVSPKVILVAANASKLRPQHAILQEVSL